MRAGESDGRRLTRAETKARTRALLLDAAAYLFAREGFAGASVDDIAEGAGFSSSAVYSNFASKEELFLELLTGRNDVHLTEAVAVLSDRSKEVAEVRSSMSRFLVDVAERDTEFAALQAEFWLYAIRRPGFRDRLAVQFRTARDGLAVAPADRNQLIDPSLEDLATVLLALFQGLAQLCRTDPTLVLTRLYGNAAHWLFAGTGTSFGREK